MTEQVDLAALAGGEAAALRTAARERGVTIHENIGPAVTRAEPTLARLLVRNVLDNAVRHNRSGGRVEVFLRGAGTGCELRVTNTGAPLSEADVASIVAPFHRGAGRLRGAGTPPSADSSSDSATNRRPSPVRPAGRPAAAGLPGARRRRPPRATPCHGAN